MVRVEGSEWSPREEWGPGSLLLPTWLGRGARWGFLHASLSLAGLCRPLRALLNLVGLTTFHSGFETRLLLTPRPASFLGPSPGELSADRDAHTAGGGGIQSTSTGSDMLSDGLVYLCPPLARMDTSQGGVLACLSSDTPSVPGAGCPRAAQDRCPGGE